MIFKNHWINDTNSVSMLFEFSGYNIFKEKFQEYVIYTQNLRN